MFSAVCGFRLDRHLDRLVQVLVGDLADGGRHRRGEQRDLLVLGRVGQDPLDILGEAHLQHLVGLVEDEVVEVADVQGALLEVVDHPARRADDDVRATLEPGQLRAVGGAAVDREHVHGQMRAVTAERLGDLQRQLAGGRQHQRLRGPAGGVDLGEDRGGERCGLAGAGLRKTDDIGTRHHGRNRGGLDRRRRFVADVGYRPQHRRVKLQVSECQIGAGRVRLGGRHRVVSVVACDRLDPPRRLPDRRTRSRYGAQS